MAINEISKNSGTAGDGDTRAPLGLKALLGGTLTLLSLAQAADIGSRLGYSYYTEQFLAVVLGLSLGLVFLGKGAAGRRRAGRLQQMLDPVLGLVGLALSFYVAWAYPSLVGRAMMLPWDALVAGSLLFLLVLEALRRCVGWVLVIVVLAICGYGLIGHLVPGVLQTREVAPARMAVYLAFDPNGLLGLTLNVAATVVIAFVFFGLVLQRCGGSEYFTELSMGLVGHRRGGQVGRSHFYDRTLCPRSLLGCGLRCSLLP